MFKENFLYEIEVKKSIHGFGFKKAGDVLFNYFKVIRFCPCCNENTANTNKSLFNVFEYLCESQSSRTGHRVQHIPIESWNNWKYSDNNCSGVWPKRFANAFYKAYDIRLPASVVSEMGNHVANSLQRDTETIRFEIVNWAGWEPGNFNESDTSCWWDEYNYARTGLIANGGYAVLFYNSKEQYDVAHPLSYNSVGYGRCWLYQIDDKLAVFNGYGFSLRRAAAYISEALGLEYRECEFNDSEDKVGWINENQGYIIGKDHFEYLYYMNYADSPVCDHCGYEMSDVYNLLNDVRVCEGCHNELTCFHCKDETYLIRVNGYTMCIPCAVYYEDYVYCASCNDAYHIDYMQKFKGDYHCEECVNLITCRVCEDVCGDELCDSCSDKLKVIQYHNKTLDEIQYSLSTVSRWSFEIGVLA